MGLGAIDDFSFGTLKKATPEKLYIYNSNPLIKQWNYTLGASLKKLLDNGYLNLVLSRNVFDNNFLRYEDNLKKEPSEINLDYSSRETENKFRLDVNKNMNGWKISYGVSAQYIEYNNSTFQVINAVSSNPTQSQTLPPSIFSYTSPLNSLWKYGAFTQLSKTFFDAKLGVSAGLRTDMNSFTSTGLDPMETLSPRLSLSYVLSDKWTANASLGSYFKLAPYTILGYASKSSMSNTTQLVNQDSKYQQSNHYVAGLEYLHDESLRFTAEAFVKAYSNVPISNRNGISLANLGGDFNVLGNEDVSTTGKGKAYGFEFFAQKKLTDKFFGILSYTYYRSLYSGFDGNLIASSWDNRHLLSLTWGYKFPRNWELGLRFRFQGGAPYSPYNEVSSKANFLSLGQGLFDYSRLNTQRLPNFHSSDVRIDKKYNLKKVTVDLFLDVTNWYMSVITGVPTYSFKRLDDNSAFATTNGLPISKDGSNAIPTTFLNDRAQVTPTIGFIVEF
jgi:outer membrane receptor for ferrienterochelin and colicin